MTRILVIVAALLIGGGGGAAWWMAAADDKVTVDSIGDSVQTRARGQLPAFAEGKDGPALYTFAVAHPEILNYMPCMCGCSDPSIGHTSNRSCYVKAETKDRVTFTSHAAT